MPVLQFDEKFRQCFWDLASAKETIRENATKTLLETLKQEQEVSSEDPQKLSYALTRLVRGLSSSRDGARQGFSLALTQVLRTFSIIKTSSYIEKVGEILPRNTNTKGREKREIYYGRIFAILVLAKAGRFSEFDETMTEVVDQDVNEDAEMKENEDSSSDDNSDAEEDKEEASDDGDDEDSLSDDGEEYNNPIDWAVSNLHELSKEKEQYEQLCYYTIAVIFRQLSKSNVLQILKTIHSSFFPAKRSDFTTSQIYFACVLEREFQWNHPDGSSFTKEALNIYSEALVKSFTSHPELHIVWKELLLYCFPKESFPSIPPPNLNEIENSNKETNQHSEYFETLWSEIIEKELFNSDSHQKKFMAFQLVEQFIHLLSVEQVSNLFTPAVSRCIINALHSPKFFLYGSVKNLIATIVKKSNDMSSKAKYTLANELLKLNRNFDGFSKSKIVEVLVSQFEIEEIELYLNDLRDQFDNIVIEKESDLDEEQTKAAIDSQRIRTLNRMFTLCRTAKNKEESFLKSVLHFYILNGFFRISENSFKAPKKSILSSAQWKFLTFSSIPASDKVIQQCRTVLTSLFKEFITLSLGSVPGEMKDGEAWPSYALRVYDEFSSLENTTEISPLSEEATNVLKSLQNLANVISKKISQLQKNENKEKNEKKKEIIKTQLKIQYAFRLLTLNCAILLYFESDNDIVEAMDDLKQAYNHISKEDPDGPDPYDVVIEIIISLLTRSSAYLRTVGTKSFSLLSNTLPNSSVKILIDVIDPFVGSLDDEDDDFMSDMEDDDEFKPFTPEEMEQIEKNKEKDTEEEEEEDSDDSDSDSDSDSDDSDDDDNVNHVIDEELEKELARLQEDDSIEEEIYIEDAPIEELQKFNERLQIMLAAMKKRAKQSEEKITIEIDHKMKVLDLLETYIHHQPSNPILFTFLSPLFKAIVAAETNKTQVNYLVKLRHFATNKFIKMTKLSLINDENHKENEKILISFYEQISPLCVGSKKLSNPTQNCVHEFLFFTLKILLGQSSSSQNDEIISLVRKTFVDSSTKPLKHFDWILFTKFIQRFGHFIYPLMDDILQYFIIKKVKPYALTKGFEFIELFCKHHSSLHTCDVFLNYLLCFFDQFSQITERKDLNVSHLISFLNTLNSCLNFFQKNNLDIDSNVSNNLIKSLESLQKESNSQKIKTRCGNCLRLLSGSNTGKRKRSSREEKDKKDSSDVVHTPKKQKSDSSQTDVSKVSTPQKDKKNKDSNSDVKTPKNKKSSTTAAKKLEHKGNENGKKTKVPRRKSTNESASKIKAKKQKKKSV